MATKKSKASKGTKKNKTSAKASNNKKSVKTDNTTEQTDTLSNDAIATTTATETVEHKPFSYDEMPYESFPYSQTHPPHLSTLASLFGLETPDLENMRVLELGCAAGGNIIPLAVDYPNAEFVGIDLSKEQTDIGKKQVKDMKLKNIKIEHLSIADLNDQFGTFDFVLCHGVFSWVPDEISDKILSICKNQLSPKGLAVISYNCLPGWSAVRSVRDMMIYHTKRFDSLDMKADQAKALVDFLHKHCEKNSPYKGILEHEQKVLKRTRKDYITHEYLEDDNTQYYFYEFIDKAKTHDLQYVGDSALATMYSGNMPKAAIQKLQSMGDIVTQEQYMDFIRNRRFRHTILTHADRKISRRIEPDKIEAMYVHSTYKPKQAIRNNNDPVEFIRPGQKAALKLSHPVAKLALAKFGETPGNPTKIADIIDFVDKTLGMEDRDAVKNMVIDATAQLALRGSIKLSVEGARWVNDLSDTPKLAPLPLYQAKQETQKWITNGLRQKISVTPVSKFIMSLCDGTHTKEDIINKLAEEMDEQGWSVRSKGEIVDDENRKQQAIKNLVDNTIAESKRRFLLVG